MDYYRGKGELANWLVSEPDFNTLHQGKCEAIMSLGNGYMGIRSANEEGYVGQVRNCFVAGTFNRFDENEVTELPNAADVTAFDIYIDNELFSLEKGEVRDYHRTLNLRRHGATNKQRNIVLANRRQASGMQYRTTRRCQLLRLVVMQSEQQPG